MAMRANYGSSQAQLECDALRLLCSELIEPETRLRLTGTLQGDMFTDDLNRVVYEEIARAGSVPIRRLKEWLPGRVTLRGFPDFELSDVLGKNGAAEDIDKLFESLLELTEQPPRIGNKALGQSA
jgi:hypothetical protein